MRKEPRPWTPEDQRIAEEMRANGASYNTIGRFLGRSDSVVRTKLKATDKSNPDHSHFYSS